MAEYRIYLLGFSGEIRSGSDAICSSDDEAHCVAQRMLDAGGQAEVWSGTRLVGRVQHTEESHQGSSKALA